MGPAAALEPPYELVVTRFKIENAQVDPLAEDVRETFGEIVEHPAPADIDHHREPFDVDGLREVHHRLRKQHRREVVDDEPAEVLQRPRRSGASGPGHAGHEYQFEWVLGHRADSPGSGGEFDARVRRHSMISPVETLTPATGAVAISVSMTD
ncbi:unannotated protein [freshwater metagenome]|uniref:Unannotated protein n=1 Tax=freshwater metagenome TaxID=449393 RepID=A0A6J7BP84_9ZZZZ